MKRFLMILLAAWLLAAPADAKDELRVACTLTDLAWLAQQVGGDDVEVVVLCPGEYDPHFLPARPSLARRLGKADLLCFNGLELEVGWLPVLLEKARNRKLRPGEPGLLDCSSALGHVLEVPEGEISRARGDVHPDGNPHYLLDPRNGVKVARLMADRMAEMRPAAAARFRERAERTAGELERRIGEWEAAAAGLRTRPVVQYHQQWEYLAGWLGLELLGDVEHRPGISPSPRHVAELARQAKAAGVGIVLAAPWNHLDAAAKAAERMEARLVVLPPAVGALPGADDYPRMFETIVQKLTADRGGAE